jgi:hypothetical protein
MRKVLQASAVILLVVAAVPALFWLAHEYRHRQRYRQLEARGELRSDVHVEVKGIADGLYEGRVVVVNTGSQEWTQGEHYFAVGVFERDITLSRVEKVQYTNGTNRLIIHADVAPGDRWESDFSIKLPASKPVLHFQIVKEGVTWFGKEAKCNTDDLHLQR